MIGMRKFVEETTKMTMAIRQGKKLAGVEEVMVPGERGDRIRSEILDSGELEVEENLLTSLKRFRGRQLTESGTDGNRFWYWQKNEPAGSQ